MCWYIYRSQIPRLDRHQCETRQSWSSLGSSGPAPRSRGLRLRGSVWSGTSCISALRLRCRVLQPQQALQSHFSLGCILDWGYKAASVHGKSAEIRVHWSRTKSMLASDPFSASFQVKNQAFIAWLRNGFWGKLEDFEAAQAAQGEEESPRALQHHAPEQGWSSRLSSTKASVAYTEMAAEDICSLASTELMRWLGTLLDRGGWTKWPPVVPSSFNYSVISHCFPPQKPLSIPLSSHSSVYAQAGTQLSPLCLESTFQVS